MLTWFMWIGNKQKKNKKTSLKRFHAKAMVINYKPPAHMQLPRPSTPVNLINPSSYQIYTPARASEEETDQKYQLAKVRKNLRNNNAEVPPKLPEDSEYKTDKTGTDYIYNLHNV